MQLPWSALLLALAMIFSGCAGDDGDGSDDAGDGMTGDEDDEDESDGENAGSDEGGAGEEETAPQQRDPVTWTIDIEGNDFVDGSLTIQAGDTVRWINWDAVAHTVTAEDGSFDSNTMSRALNQEFDWTFKESGDFPYFCEFHSSMTDTITVLAVYDGTPE